ncbi:MAG: lipoprotein-releasing system ATP-binding protein [Pseudohongiellaceae bacterium]|jgi:lipoprotein-releasing system ATP-binding protein
MSDLPILAAQGLARHYRMGGKQLSVLSDLSLELFAGEKVAIMGRSGAGKSTLLHLLGLLDRPDAGTMQIRGQEITKLSRGARARLRNQEVGFVFQFYHLIPELTAIDNAMLPAMIAHGPLAWLSVRKKTREWARSLFAELGLEGRMKHRPNQLSGGERQRVAIARALCSQPGLLLCDEPTGNLDEQTSVAITELLFDLTERHSQTLIMVTHDAELASQADRLLILHDGGLAEQPAPPQTTAAQE